jgi:hypothetical protein
LKIVPSSFQDVFACKLLIILKTDSVFRGKIQYFFRRRRLAAALGAVVKERAHATGSPDQGGQGATGANWRQFDDTSGRRARQRPFHASRAASYWREKGKKNPQEASTPGARGV